MGKFVERNGFISNRGLWTSIVTDMIANGFTLVSVDGEIASSIQAGKQITKVVLDASAAVDPLFESQPWRLCIEATDTYTKVNAATEEQISDAGEITTIGHRLVDGTSALIKSGAIGTYQTGAKGSEKAAFATLPIAERDTFFYHKGKVDASLNNVLYGSMTFPLVNKIPKPLKVNVTEYPYEYPSPADLTQEELLDPRIGTLAATDAAAMPFSYVLSISSHGIALSTWIESRDDEGCRFNWFVIQRAINSDGTVVTTGKAPLFAMFSSNGGGTREESLYYPGSYGPDASGIQRFTVRESDINAPSLPVSASSHSSDAFAVINPMQQVCLGETGMFDFRLPQGFNSHRHSYVYEIDMIGYASADIISHRTDLSIQVYNETDGANPVKRTYRALNANGAKNTGMRLFMLKSGGGV